VNLKVITNTGDYVLLDAKGFTKPQKGRIFWQRLLNEIQGLASNPSVSLHLFQHSWRRCRHSDRIQHRQSFYSSFHGRVYGTPIGHSRISPTVISLILAGKWVHDRLRDRTMRVTEQIDALEIMGVNSANYLILPKVVASMLINPVLIVLSMWWESWADGWPWAHSGWSPRRTM